MKIPKHLIHTFVLFLLLAVPRSATARHTFSFNVLPGVVTSSYYPVPGRSYVNRTGLGFSMGYRYMSSGGFGGEASFSHCQTFYPYNGHLNCNFYDISLVYGHDFSKKWMAVIGGGVGVAVCLNQFDQSTRLGPQFMAGTEFKLSDRIGLGTDIIYQSNSFHSRKDDGGASETVGAVSRLSLQVGIRVYL